MISGAFETDGDGDGDGDGAGDGGDGAAAGVAGGAGATGAAVVVVVAGVGDPPQAARSRRAWSERMTRRYASRSRPSLARVCYPDEMSVRFVDRRPRGPHAPLTRVEQRQLDMIGTLYFGGAGLVRLVDDDFEDDPLATRSLMTVDTWRGVRGDQHVHDAWFYMGDSGTIFRARSTEVVAEIIQCGLQCDDSDARAALGAALVEAKLLPTSDGSYREFAALLAAQRGPAAMPRPKAKGTVKARAKGPAKSKAKSRARPTVKAKPRKASPRATSKPAPKGKPRSKSSRR